MIIDYLGHSGFLVETAEALLLFDAYRADLTKIGERPAGKPVFVFVSHAHGDHFDPAVFALRGRGRQVRYVLSFDIRGNSQVPPGADALYTDADETYAVDGLGTVRTLFSTDEGVAFLVKTGKETLYHAGDLHWWDWEGEDPAWLTEQERVFKREVRLLETERIDAAFIVLDDRLGPNYAKGAEWFLSVCRPAYALPNASCVSARSASSASTSSICAG